jgi:hypothetical protein
MEGLHGSIARPGCFNAQLERTRKRQEDAVGHFASKKTFGRRQFLHALGAVTATSVPFLIKNANADSETTDEKRKARYRESDHVKTFYRLNAYPR